MQAAERYDTHNKKNITSISERLKGFCLTFKYNIKYVVYIHLSKMSINYWINQNKRCKWDSMQGHMLRPPLSGGLVSLSSNSLKCGQFRCLLLEIDVQTNKNMFCTELRRYQAVISLPRNSTLFCAWFMCEEIKMRPNTSASFTMFLPKMEIR